MGSNLLVQGNRKKQAESSKQGAKDPGKSIGTNTVKRLREKASIQVTQTPQKGNWLANTLQNTRLHANILLTWVLLQISDAWSLAILFVIRQVLWLYWDLICIFVTCQPKIIFSFPWYGQTLIKQSLSAPWPKGDWIKPRYL